MNNITGYCSLWTVTVKGGEVLVHLCVGRSLAIYLNPTFHIHKKKKIKSFWAQFDFVYTSSSSKLPSPPSRSWDSPLQPVAIYLSQLELLWAQDQSFQICDLAAKASLAAFSWFASPRICISTESSSFCLWTRSTGKLRGFTRSMWGGFRILPRPQPNYSFFFCTDFESFPVQHCLDRRKKRDQEQEFLFGFLESGSVDWEQKCIPISCWDLTAKTCYIVSTRRVTEFWQYIDGSESDCDDLGVDSQVFVF